jgi:hypothetical protein
MGQHKKQHFSPQFSLGRNLRPKMLGHEERMTRQKTSSPGVTTIQISYHTASTEPVLKSSHRHKLLDPMIKLTWDAKQLPPNHHLTPCYSNRIPKLQPKLFHHIRDHLKRSIRSIDRFISQLILGALLL